jgi:hypothetical protein
MIDDQEKTEYMEGLHEHLNEFFADFIVVGIDINDDKGRIINVGSDGGPSKANSARIARIIGELHDVIFNLQMISNGLICDEEDICIEEDDNDEDNLID